MSVSKEEVQAVLQKISLPDGGDLISRDFVRALNIREKNVQLVLRMCANRSKIFFFEKIFFRP